MTDREIRQQLSALPHEELMSIWQNAPDPDNLTKRERMARDLCNAPVIAAEARPTLSLFRTASQAPAA